MRDSARDRLQPNFFAPLSLLYAEGESVSTSNQEALWVLRAQCDDREALELLLRQIQPALRRYLASVVGASDADDVLC